MAKVILTVAAAFCGGWLGIRLKIPAGGLIGAMLAVGVLQINKAEAEMPMYFRLIGEILVGGAIGLGFTRDFLGSLRELILPSVVIMISVVVFGVLIGLLIHKTTNLDLVTSIFASSPGGITNMTIISGSLGANSKVVAVMQLIRLISLIFLLPLIIKLLAKMGL